MIRNFQKYLTFLALIFVYFIFTQSKCTAQGVDAGEADPFKFGLIDPVALEIAATYVYVVPFVIFTIGILVIPPVLVITYLILIPLYVPPLPEGEGRRFSGSGRVDTSSMTQTLLDSAMSMLGRSQCIHRVICEISYAKNSNPVRETNGSSQTVNNGNVTSRPGSIHQSKRKVYDRSTCSRHSCIPYDFLTSVGNATMRMLQ